jgi:hypothetical protein
LIKKNPDREDRGFIFVSCLGLIAIAHELQQE